MKHAENALFVFQSNTGFCGENQVAVALEDLGFIACAEKFWFWFVILLHP